MDKLSQMCCTIPATLFWGGGGLQETTDGPVDWIFEDIIVTCKIVIINDNVQSSDHQDDTKTLVVLLMICYTFACVMWYNIVLFFIVYSMFRQKMINMNQCFKDI